MLPMVVFQEVMVLMDLTEVSNFHTVVHVVNNNNNDHIFPHVKGPGTNGQHGSRGSPGMNGENGEDVHIILEGISHTNMFISGTVNKSLSLLGNGKIKIISNGGNAGKGGDGGE